MCVHNGRDQTSPPTPTRRRGEGPTRPNGNTLRVLWILGQHILVVRPTSCRGSSCRAQMTANPPVPRRYLSPRTTGGGSWQGHPPPPDRRTRHQRLQHGAHVTLLTRLDARKPSPEVAPFAVVAACVRIRHGLAVISLVRVDALVDIGPARSVGGRGGRAPIEEVVVGEVPSQPAAASQSFAASLPPL